MAISITRAQATVMSSSEWKKWKVPGMWSATAYDSKNRLFIFYEYNDNISCFVSFDDGINFFCYYSIIRLLEGETARKPYVVSNKQQNKMYLFYIFNNNYLAMKEIDTTLFTEVDSYINIEELEVFTKDTSDNAGLENFSNFGKGLRKSPSVLIDGFFGYGSAMIWLEIEDVNTSRLSSGKSIRFFPGKDQSEYNTFWSGIPFGAYQDVNNVFRVWYVKDDLVNIISSYDGISWKDTLKDIYFHRYPSWGTEDESYSVDDFKKYYEVGASLYCHNNDTFSNVYECWNPFDEEEDEYDQGDDVEEYTTFIASQNDAVGDLIEGSTSISRITRIRTDEDGIRVATARIGSHGGDLEYDTGNEGNKIGDSFGEGVIVHIENINNVDFKLTIELNVPPDPPPPDNTEIIRTDEWSHEDYIKTPDPELKNLTVCQEGGYVNYKSDSTECVGTIMEIETVYDKWVNQVVIIITMDYGVFVRVIPSDMLALVDTMTENQKKKKGEKVGTLEYVVENLINLTPDSPNRFTQVAGKISGSNSAFVPIDVRNYSPEHFVWHEVKPTGYFSKANFCKIFYMDKRTEEYDESEYDSQIASDIASSNDTSLWWVTLYFNDLTPYVKERK